MDTRSQWNNFLQNVGVWEGYYTTYTIDAKEINEVPSCFTIEALNNNQSARSRLQRENCPDLRLEFSHLPKNAIYHADGSYSQGNIQYAPYDDFACEFGLIHENRRLRSKVLFDVAGYPGRIILMRESQADNNSNNQSIKRFSVKDLLGKWKGVGTTIYLDSRPSVEYSTHIHFYIDQYKRLAQDLLVNGHELHSSAQIKGQLMKFDSDSQQIQNLVLLPRGASVSFPAKLQMRKPVYLELAWLVEPGIRHRITRYYNKFGEWKEVSFMIEEKVR